MSAKPPADDPRMLLPEWLRDEDASPDPVSNRPEPIVETGEHQQASVRVAVIRDPYSQRLAVDDMLDPRALVSESDLPAWLGSLAHAPTEPAHDHSRRPEPASSPIKASTVTVSDPGPKVGSAPSSARSLTEAPASAARMEPDAIEPNPANVVDVTLEGWQLTAVAIGLLVLLAAALRLYLN